ncbi:MAG: hypothetical protein HQ510_10635 [Candidatus Marinimicrobia bacterium]|nr:hypothetical protein [Candidatus Neomarinimicrobiota bacterium]
MLKQNSVFIIAVLLFLGCSGDDSSSSPGISGCTDPAATNYNLDATADDGSCTYENQDITGCPDPEASNYNPNATIDDGSCAYVHFQMTLDNTGESHLVVFQTSITMLDIGDEVGIFDASGRTNYQDCSNQSGEILVGTGIWTGEQLNLACEGSLDMCPFGGIQLPGYIDGHTITIRVWDESAGIEIPVIAQFSTGAGLFGEWFSVISDLFPR